VPCHTGLAAAAAGADSSWLEANSAANASSATNNLQSGRKNGRCVRLTTLLAIRNSHHGNTHLAHRATAAD
jgi:hypothetical protein